MGKNKKENYLDYIPKHNERYTWQENKSNHVEVTVHNRGLFNRIAQIVFKRPKASQIELDDFGSFVWRQIDGKRSVYEIAMLIKEKFGEEAEPLFVRATQFFQVLRKNEFIVYMNKK